MDVSVLISTYQRPEELDACLRSIAAQEGNLTIEVCVVNDGGEDVGHIVSRYASLHPKYLHMHTNVGHVKARNEALAMASGDFIAICDDDDRWLPQHLVMLYDAWHINGQNSWNVIYTDAELVYLEEGKRVSKREAFAFHDARALLERYNPVVPSSILYHHSLHELIGPFDEAIGHYWDWDLLLRVKDKGNLHRIPICLTLYGVSAKGGNLSADPQRMQPELERLIAKHCLDTLPTSNFSLMLQASDLRQELATTQLVWDGTPEIWRT